MSEVLLVSLSAITGRDQTSDEAPGKMPAAAAAASVVTLGKRRQRPARALEVQDRMARSDGDRDEESPPVSPVDESGSPPLLAPKRHRRTASEQELIGEAVQKGWGRVPAGFLEAFSGVLVAKFLISDIILADGEAALASRFTGYGLTCFSGIAFVVVAYLLSKWSATRWVGETMLSRVRNTQLNWQNHTLRSFTEVLSWLYVIFRTYRLLGDIGLSLLLSSISGCVMVAFGEIFASHYQELEHSLTHSKADSAQRAAGGADCRKSCKGCPRRVQDVSSTNVMHVSWLAFFGLVAVGHTQDMRDLMVGLGLATLTGSTFIAFGQMLTCWRPTHRCGVVLQRRITNTSENWEKFPLRSVSPC